MEVLAEQLGSSNAKYEDKKERFKLRSDRIFEKIVDFLAPSEEAQADLLQSFI